MHNLKPHCLGPSFVGYIMLLSARGLACIVTDLITGGLIGLVLLRFFAAAAPSTGSLSN